ncbi:hypothetical protein [Endothiovibrio diazotrophicus]
MNDQLCVEGDAREFIEALQEWHENRIGQLRQILAHSDADIQLGPHYIEGQSELAKGIRIGISVAIDLLGVLPFNVQKPDPVEVGRDAYWAYEDLSDCPYPAGSDDAAQWKRGWQEAAETLDVEEAE